MRKCFIVTWFNMGRNYGQTLQALAMQTILSRMNLNTQILNYCSTSIIYPCNMIQKLVRNIFIKKENWKLQREFDKFVKKYLKVTKYYCNYNRLRKWVMEQDPEYIICGSDQIWNPYNVNQFYYLHNLGTSNTKKIAYAVSLCDVRKKDKFLEYPQIKEWIKDFYSINSRENTGRDIIKEFFNAESNVVFDPTLLLCGNEWIELLDIKKNNDKYILCYAFNLTKEQQNMIEERANSIGVEVIYAQIFVDRKKDKSINAWSPKDFVSKIYNAKEVYTDSFHGMIFSILFEKEFYVFDNGEDKNSDNYYNIDRMKTVLNMLELESRINPENIHTYKKIVYKNINKILEEKRKKDLELLRNLTHNTYER